jgi:hypothetical protein
MVGAEDDPVLAGEAEMIAGMAGRMQRDHAGDAVAIAQQDIGREGGIGAEMEGVGHGAGAGLQRSRRAEMVGMGVAEQDRLHRGRPSPSGCRRDGRHHRGRDRARRSRPASRSDRCWCHDRSSGSDYWRRCAKRLESPAASRRARGPVRSGRPCSKTLAEATASQNQQPAWDEELQGLDKAHSWVKRLAGISAAAGSTMHCAGRGPNSCIHGALDFLSQDMPRPTPSSALSRLRVLDLSRVRAGPTCVRIFADFGADVIKVESPPGSIPTRT